MSYPMILLDGRPVTLRDAERRRGGQAEVRSVAEDPGIVVKLYDDLQKHALEQEQRVRVMRNLQPLGGRLIRPGQPPELAWPVGIATDLDGTFIGYSMRKFGKPDHTQMVALLEPAGRRRLFADRMTWGSLLTIASSAAGVVEQLHEEGILVGDLSSRNIVVSVAEGYLTFLDCDSFAFTDPRSGTYYPSRWHTDDYAAPERTRGDGLEATVASDDFALAVLIYQLLTGGDHPFAGQPQGQENWTPGDNIKDGNSHVVHPDRFVVPGAATKPDDLVLPADRMDPAVLPKRALLFARQAFGPGLQDPARRPTARQWRAALEEAQDYIKVCTSDPDHEYAEHLAGCPWCGPVIESKPVAPPTVISPATPARPVVRAEPEVLAPAAAPWVPADSVPQPAPAYQPPVTPAPMPQQPAAYGATPPPAPYGSTPPPVPYGSTPPPPPYGSTPPPAPYGGTPPRRAASPTSTTTIIWIIVVLAFLIGLAIWLAPLH